jgi:hypothetical protein
VKQRYGKWVAQLEGEPEILKILQGKGVDALRTFGYEPRNQILDISPMTLRQAATCIIQNQK